MIIINLSQIQSQITLNIMYQHPTVSSFTLKDGQTLAYREVLSKDRTIIRPQVIFNNQSSIRHKKQTSYQQKIQKHRYSNIRQQVDNYLDNVYNPCSKHHKSYFNTNASTISKTPSITQGPPLLDNNMVMNYVQTIFKDYNIKNRYQSLIPSERVDRKKGLDMTYHHVRKNTQVDKSDSHGQSKHRKRFLSLSNPQKLSNPSNTLKQCSVSKPQDPSTNYKSPILKPKSINDERSQKSHYLFKICQTFKYCINCQRKILQANINYHEQYECSSFKQIYKLNFYQLSLIIEQKIKKIRFLLKEKIEVFKIKKQRIGKIYLELIDSIETYISFSREANQDKDQIYNKIYQNKQTELYEVIELTEKLKYFEKIYDKLVVHHQMTYRKQKLNMTDFPLKMMQRCDFSF